MPLYTRPHLQNAQVTLEVRNLPANTGDVRDVGSTSGLGRCPGGGHGNPLQFSCLENPMEREVWQATAHGYAKRWTWLKRLSMHRMHKTFSKQPIKRKIYSDQLMLDNRLNNLPCALSKMIIFKFSYFFGWYITSGIFSAFLKNWSTVYIKLYINHRHMI